MLQPGTNQVRHSVRQLIRNWRVPTYASRLAQRVPLLSAAAAEMDTTDGVAPAAGKIASLVGWTGMGSARENGVRRQADRSGDDAVEAPGAFEQVVCRVYQ